MLEKCLKQEKTKLEKTVIFLKIHIYISDCLDYENKTLNHQTSHISAFSDH